LFFKNPQKQLDTKELNKNYTNSYSKQKAAYVDLLMNQFQLDIYREVIQFYAYD